MTPQEQQEFNDMKEWIAARKVQQLTSPLDPVSQIIVAPTVVGKGLGATALTQVYTDSRGDTVTGPKAYLDTIIVNIGGVNYEIPFVANPS